MQEPIDAREMIFIKALMKTNQDNKRLCAKDSTPPRHINPYGTHSNHTQITEVIFHKRM